MFCGALPLPPAGAPALVGRLILGLALRVLQGGAVGAGGGGGAGLLQHGVVHRGGDHLGGGGAQDGVRAAPMPARAAAE